MHVDAGHQSFPQTKYKSIGRHEKDIENEIMHADAKLNKAR